jgi:hypothetical protein
MGKGGCKGLFLVERPGLAAGLRGAAAKGAGEKEGAAVVIFGAAAEIADFAVDGTVGESSPALAVGFVVEGTDLGDQHLAAATVTSGDFATHGKTPFCLLIRL